MAWWRAPPPVKQHSCRSLVCYKLSAVEKKAALHSVLESGACWWSEVSGLNRNTNLLLRLFLVFFLLLLCRPIDVCESCFWRLLMFIGGLLATSNSNLSTVIYVTVFIKHHKLMLKFWFISANFTSSICRKWSIELDLIVGILNFQRSILKISCIDIKQSLKSLAWTQKKYLRPCRALLELRTIFGTTVSLL